jgi:hypothetical protein
MLRDCGIPDDEAKDGWTFRPVGRVFAPVNQALVRDPFLFELNRTERCIRDIARVDAVSVRPEGSGLGRSQHTPAGDGAIPSERQRENIVALAGWAAELASGEANENGTYDSADLTFVLSRLDQHAPSRIEIELGWAESEAQRISFRQSRADRALGA